MRSNRAGVTIGFKFQVQLVALQHLTATGVILSPSAMHSLVAFANAPASTPSSCAGRVAGLGGITTVPTITSGVRWIVFA